MQVIPGYSVSNSSMFHFIQEKSFGEGYVANLVNNSMTFTSGMEDTLAELDELNKTVCLVDRLSAIYRSFMRALRYLSLIHI